MGQSLILLIEELAPGMTEAFAAVNDGFAALEQAISLPLALDMTAEGASYVLAEIDLVRYFHFQISDQTQAIDFVLPSEVNGNPAYRVIAVTNLDATYNVTVTTTAGEEVIVYPGETVLVHQVEDDVFRLTQTSSSFSMGGYVSGVPASSLEILRYVASETVVFPANWQTFGVGTVTFTAQPDDTDTVIINDGLRTVTFEFDSGGGVTGSNVAVTIGASFDATGTALAAAINAANINVAAWYDTGTNVCTIRNLNGAGGSIGSTSASPDFSVTDFTGGVNGARGSIGTLATLDTVLAINKIVGATTTEIGTIRIRPLGGFNFRSGTRESGTLHFAAQPNDADTFTISDGFITVVFEFDNNASVTAPNTSVTIGGSIDATGANLVAAIMASALNLEATYDGSGTTDLVTIKNNNCTGGSLADSDGGNTRLVTVNFSGGVAAAVITLSPGNALTVVNQATADATAANIAFTLKGQRI